MSELALAQRGTENTMHFGLDWSDGRFVLQGTEELEVRILVQARPGQDIRLVSYCVVCPVCGI